MTTDTHLERAEQHANAAQTDDAIAAALISIGHTLHRIASALEQNGARSK